MKKNKYYAFITFGHNGVTIKAGDIFDPDEVKFSKEDIDFLKSQQKIIARPEYITSQPELVDEFKLERPIVKPVEKPTEVTSEDTVDIVTEDIVKTAEDQPKDSYDEKKVIEPVPDLNLMKRADLIKLAEKLNIENSSKLTKNELVKKISEINS